MKYRNVHRAVFDMRASFIPGAVWIFRFIHPKSLLFYFLFAGMKSLIGFLMKSSYTLCESAVCSTQKQNGFVWSFGCARSGGERDRERECMQIITLSHRAEPASATLFCCVMQKTLCICSPFWPSVFRSNYSRWNGCSCINRQHKQQHTFSIWENETKFAMMHFNLYFRLLWYACAPPPMALLLNFGNYLWNKRKREREQVEHTVITPKWINDNDDARVQWIKQRTARRNMGCQSR